MKFQKRDSWKSQCLEIRSLSSDVMTLLSHCIPVYLLLILMMQHEPIPDVQSFFLPVVLFFKCVSGEVRKEKNILCIIYFILLPQTMIPLVALVSSKFSRLMKDTPYDVTSPISDLKLKLKFSQVTRSFWKKKHRLARWHLVIFNLHSGISYISGRWVFPFIINLYWWQQK